MPVSSARRRTTPEPTVERKIYFYELDAGQKDGEPIEFDPVPVLSHINTLPFKMDGRYLDGGEGNVSFAIPKSLEYPQRVIYVLSRRSNLPELECGGDMIPLPIPIDSGLGEKIHVMFFGRYAAADYNFYGPRATALSTYFALRAKGIGPRVRLQQLIRGEAAEDLKKLDGIILARFKFHESALRLVEQANVSLAAAFRATIAATGADELELVLRKKRGRGGVTRYLSPDFFKGVRELARIPDTYEEFERLVAEGVSRETAQRAEVDILDDQLILKRKMIKVHKRFRAVQSESAFLEIESAFQEVLPRLNVAGAVMR